MIIAKPTTGDALVIVDVQIDFLPGGSLAVSEGDQILPVLNKYIELFSSFNLAVVATRDWHPPNHCSFKSQGGIWPPHCVADSEGAKFSADLHLPENVLIISKATHPDKEAFSGLEDTDLDKILKDMNIERAWVGGLATDYCVFNTVTDFISKKYQVLLLEDAIRAVNLNPDDGIKAEKKMMLSGAQAVRFEEIQ